MPLILKDTISVSGYFTFYIQPGNLPIITTVESLLKNLLFMDS